MSAAFPRILACTIAVSVAAISGCAPASPPVSAAARSWSLAAERDAQIAYLRALTRAEPRHWRAEVWLSSLLGQAGDARSAFDAARRARDVNRENPHLQRVLALTAAELDFLDWELFAWRVAALKDPRNGFPPLMLARRYRLLGWPEKAATLLTLAIQRNPTLAEAYAEQALLFARRPGEMHRLAVFLRDRLPESPYGFSLLADEAAEGARFDEALALGSEAVSRDRTDLSLPIRLAEYRTARGKPGDAAAALAQLQALKVDATDPAYARALGAALAALNRPQDALSAIERGLGGDPQNRALLAEAARLCRATGRPDAAREFAGRLERVQQADDALAAGLRRLRAEPTSARAHLALARLRLARGETGAAVVECLAAAQSEGRLGGETQDVLQEALTKQGRTQRELAPGALPGEPTGEG